MRLQGISVKATGATILAVAFLFLGSFSFAKADTILTGYTPATTTTQQVGTSHHGLNNYWAGQSFEIDDTRTITGFSMQFQGVIGESYTGYLVADLGNYLVRVATSSSSCSLGSQNNVCEFTFSSPYTAEAGNYIVVANFSYNTFGYFYGTRSNVYENGCVTEGFLMGASGVNCDTTYDSEGSDAYFEVYASELTTGITDINSPANYISYATPNIIFSYDLYSAVPAVASYGIQLVDLTTAQTIDTSAYTVTNLSSGAKTYTKSITLTENHRYQWRAFLLTTSGYIYSSYYYFNTGVSTPEGNATSSFYGFIDEFINGTDAGSIISNFINNGDFNSEANAATSTSGGIASFGNIPSYFAQRIPIGYVYDIYDIWNNVSTSTDEFGALSIDFDSLDLPTSTRSWLPGEIVFFSTSTVTSYVDDTLLDLLNTLASSVIAISWAMYIFRSATTIIKPV